MGNNEIIDIGEKDDMNVLPFQRHDNLQEQASAVGEALKYCEAKFGPMSTWKIANSEEFEAESKALAGADPEQIKARIQSNNSQIAQIMTAVKAVEMKLASARELMEMNAERRILTA